jgi:hypothetical protein
LEFGRAPNRHRAPEPRRRIIVKLDPGEIFKSGALFLYPVRE